MKKINLSIESNISIEKTMDSITKICHIFETADDLFLDIDLICMNNTPGNTMRLVQWFGKFIEEFKKSSNFVVAAGLSSPAQFYSASHVKKIGRCFNRLIIFPSDEMGVTSSAINNIKKIPTKHCLIYTDCEPAEAYRQYSNLGCDIICRNSYNDDVCGLFSKWKCDKKGADLSVFSDIFKQSMYKYTSYDCSHNSCMGKYFFVSSDGIVSFCRKHPERSQIEHIENIENISQLMSGDNFRSTLIRALEKRKKCRNSCIDFSKCGGGCPLNNGECSERDYICLYDQIVNEFNILFSQSDYGTVNPALRQAFISAISSGRY